MDRKVREEARRAAALAADDYFSGADRAYGEHIKCADAAIDAYEAALQVAGYVMVPREPTEAMWEAAVFADEFHTPETEYSLPRAIWSAMIEAATNPAP